MNKQSRTKRLLAPLAQRNPDLVYVSDWMVVLPLQHVFRGIRLDMTSRKGIFRPVWTISDLLFVQTSPGVDGFIDYHRYSNGPHFYDDLNEQAQSEILCRLIEEHTLPFLRSTDTLEAYYRLRTHALRPISLWPPMHFRLELAMGHFEIARYLARRFRDDWFSRSDRGTVHTLVGLLDADDHAGIATLLHEWEAVTAKNFRIEQVWEPAPFPFETA
jgi:hypothetical protein